MTLRTKLMLALVLLSALVTVSIGSIAYFATENQLTTEVDTSLQDVAAYAAAQPGGRDGGPHTEGRGAVQLQNMLVQVLGSNGAVVSSPDGVSVPVSTADRAIAAAGSGSAYREVQVDGHPYRMLTTGSDHGAVQVLHPLSEDRSVLAALRLRIVLAAVVVIVAATACGWLVSRRITRRLRTLASAAGHVAETNRLDVAIDTDGADETAQLARAFTGMLAALERSQLSQRRLVQDAGHELRTPLTSVQTNLDVLARHPDLDPERHRAVVADLHGETRQLTLLVNELIDLSLGSTADSTPEELPLAGSAQRLADRVRRRSGRAVVVTADDSVGLVVPAQWERAVANLLDNAVKFSDDGAPVELSISGGRVAVRDYGPGIADTDLPRVFDRFFRSDRARQLPGSGLGLSIVFDVATRAGGTVFAHNHPGGGAVVGFALPPAGALQPGFNPG